MDVDGAAPAAGTATEEPEAKQIAMPSWDDEDEMTMQAPEGAGELGAAQLRDAKLEAEKAANKKRAERFGTEYVEPSSTKLFGVKRASVRPGFAVGFDVTNEEEKKKMAARAARFGDMIDKPKAMDPALVEERNEVLTPICLSILSYHIPLLATLTAPCAHRCVAKTLP